MSADDVGSYLNSIVQGSPQGWLLAADTISNVRATLAKQPASTKLEASVNLDADALGRIFKLTKTSDGTKQILATARSALLAAANSSSAYARFARVIMSAAAHTEGGGAALLQQLQGKDEDAIATSIADATGAPVTTSGGVDAPGHLIAYLVTSINTKADDLLQALVALAGVKTTLDGDASKATGPQNGLTSSRDAQSLESINQAVLKGFGGWIQPFSEADTAPAGPVALLVTLASLGNVPRPVLTTVLRIGGGNKPSLLAFS